MKREYLFPAILDFTEKHIAIIFPDLEEALSQADTTEQAMQRASDVLRLTLESRMNDGELIPDPTPLNEISIQNGQRTILVSCSLDKKIKYDKKTLTIPHDLNIAAEEVGINFSHILQKALRDKLTEME